MLRRMAVAYAAFMPLEARGLQHSVTMARTLLRRRLDPPLTSSAGRHLRCLAGVRDCVSYKRLVSRPRPADDRTPFPKTALHSATSTATTTPRLFEVDNIEAHESSVCICGQAYFAHGDIWNHQRSMNCPFVDGGGFRLNSPSNSAREES